MFSFFCPSLASKAAVLNLGFVWGFPGGHEGVLAESEGLSYSFEEGPDPIGPVPLNLSLWGWILSHVNSENEGTQ